MHGTQRPAASPSRRFHLELIKPSHYDDDGYVIQWWRSWIPSNSLASVYGIASDAARRRVLGPDTEIVVTPYDEGNKVIPVGRIARRISENPGGGLVCLVGVQSNQFPRAMDIARELRAAGVAVAIGGFHVSGCLAMLPEPPPDIREALELGIALFAGEAEGRLADVIADAAAGRLQPIYDFLADLPDLGGQPTPYLPAEDVARYAGTTGCFDAGRGCPFTCSFCTIINVQGHKSRFRGADDVESIVRQHAAQGIDRFFISDDNFARNKNWEAIFDRLIALREREGLSVNFLIQVDTLCHKIPRFIEKAAEAGCKKAFIGLENINPDSLKAAHKGQNKITEYRAMLQAWRAQGILTYGGYILGFPTDTPETIERDIGIIQRELPIDILEFNILTPLPGSADHKHLHAAGVPMDPDMNKYDLEHVTTDHPLMSREQWQAAYQRAWEVYYSPEHVETLLRRALASGIKPVRMVGMIFQFYAATRYEGIHPLQAGFVRRKLRTQRRPGWPREAPVPFYLRYGWQLLVTNLQMLTCYLRIRLKAERIRRMPGARDYRDLALAPSEATAEDGLALFQVTGAAAAALSNTRARSERIRKARAGARTSAGA